LINDKKFDLRVYVLVLDVGSNSGADTKPMLAFISKEALVRFCTLPYEKPNSQNMHKLLSHLTNYTLNKLSENYVNSEDLT
jgi:tubulin polyglutamylase TTLL6/13